MDQKFKLGDLVRSIFGQEGEIIELSGESVVVRVQNQASHTVMSVPVRLLAIGPRPSAHLVGTKPAVRISL